MVKGECPAVTWLQGLDTKANVQFRARFDQLTTVGYLRISDQFNDLQCPGRPPVYEIKVNSGYRMYVVRSERDWVATHGTKKPAKRKVCIEAERARGIWEEAREG